VNTVSREELVTTARHAFDVADAMAWKTYDPYDILLSPFTALVRGRSPLLARVLLQVGRRAGPRTRSLLRIAPHEEPKALADFLQAAVALARNGEDWAAGYAPQLALRLRATATHAPAGCGWGLQFPWMSRFGGIDAAEPNIYTTTVACRALIDEYELTRDEQALETATAGGRFILDGLGSVVHRGRPWLRYTAGSTSPIVNVQASSASLFARLSGVTGEERFLEVADRSAEIAVAAQRADGSWPYSDDGAAPFVDGFHSGFTLQGLREYAELRPNGVAGVVSAVERGLAYFRAHLLTPDGLPRRFADGRRSTDGQNLAQCIQTLVVCGNSADAEVAARIWQFGRARLRLDRAARPALRWSVGPFVLATAYLLEPPRG
jgi:hypothetical protein